MRNRDFWLFCLVGGLVAAAVVYIFVDAPTNTDAYYYINAANRAVSGEGLTDAVLWNYIGMPEEIPAPSHSYWMPMASLVALAGMWLLRAPVNYVAAQSLFVPLLLLLGASSYWITRELGGNRRQGWIAGLMVMLGGFYAPFWGMPETFTPFGAFGVGALVVLGRGLRRGGLVWFALAGGLTAGAHLTRADGPLFLIAAVVSVGWFWNNSIPWGRRALYILVMLIAYLLAMSPWFARNMAAIGTPLPVGGTQGIWYTEYNDIFNFPPDASPGRFFELGGWDLLWSSRWLALSNGMVTLLVVEGFVVLFPLMILGFVRRVGDVLLRPFWVYALGLHIVMTLVFPFPGYRGGLFHSAAALMPFWAALAVLGLDDAVQWAARRRRWNLAVAQNVFSGAALLLVLSLSIYLGLQPSDSDARRTYYEAIASDLPADAQVMTNDPSAFYYYTGVGGVTLPNEDAVVIPQIADRYSITHLILEGVQDGIATQASDPLLDLPSNPPSFLRRVPVPDNSVRVYRIELPE